MRSRLALVVAVATLAAPGCASDHLGRGLPDCDLREVGSEIISQAQAVPGATVGACVAELEPGWSYEHQVAQSGSSRFWLSSDRMGDRFVEVALVETCDPGSSIRQPRPEPEIEAFVEGWASIQPVELTLVPSSQRAIYSAATVGVDLSDELVRGRPFELRMAPADDPSVQISRALADGRMVIFVDDTVMDGTVDLLIPGEEPESGLTIDQAVEEIEERVEDAHYDATWYFVFEGGCIVWDFDAEGEMVASVERDMFDAVGFFDLTEIRRTAAEMGYYLGP